MPRQLRLIFPATLLASCVVFSGCKTVYSDMYSPRRNYFVPPKEKPKEISIPIEEIAPPSTPETPAGLLPPAPPSAAPVTPPPPAPADPALPAIPGLNP
jgi:hypothetical protein